MAFSSPFPTNEGKNRPVGWRSELTPLAQVS